MGPVCPVCEQPIDEESVRRHLEEVLRSATADGRAASAAQQAVADAQAKVPTHRPSRLDGHWRLGGSNRQPPLLLKSPPRETRCSHVGHEWMNASQGESLLGALNELRGELHQVELALKQTAGDRLAEAEAAAGARTVTCLR